MTHDAAGDAQLALLLELAATPKPGNVDRERDHPDLRFEQFLAGAVGARRGFDAAAAGAPVGDAFETAVAGMAARARDNTQFGALLLLVPLVAAAATGDDGEVTPAAVADVIDATTVEDAAGFYRAFEHVDVRVGAPPDDCDALDVRRGRDAIPALRSRELTLAEAVTAGAPTDGVAREWADGFERTFDAAEALRTGTAPLPERVSRTFLRLLAADPDGLVAARHGDAVAERVSDRAAALADADRSVIDAWADDLVDAGINPGTTADVVAAALFVALSRGVRE
ncbi:triphosphoribosyl-dephospho-CoA synthase [Halarchaeum rubridurum]|uniref:2-(5''-triphosphoribosyl)-3'-dephosphocoenzyme-A synthase n=1 Tax=Halarchaeum rubridurum TaxID=489911 RepID=A0A830FKH8_9EURY|nr:triphosphoribosyl-dephospho-CoA synthase [Halarchaeum rubridurum]MBP1954754.1 triphosphoribosyl-dephospho-CoA synthase [Halarchaeum rubridurum]GGM59515.1 2-(5''-triphosphoribosyl)-3'-dephosphocoenzyme-A synthase [Halarchaeum rubridurum]